MRRNGKIISFLLCLSLLVVCSLFITTSTLFFHHNMNATSPEIDLNNDETSFEEFSQALNHLLQNYAAEDNSLIFFDKENDLITDDEGNYLVSEQTFNQYTGKEEKKMLRKNSGAYFTAQNETTYQLDDIARETGYNITNGEKNVILTRKFGLKRLIIYTDSKKLDTCDAIATVSYNDLRFHQYATEEDASKAFTYYQNCPDVKDVYADSYCWVEDNTMVEIDPDATLTYKTWGADRMGVPAYSAYLQDVAKTSDSALPEVVVAILDTGIDTDHPWFTDRLLVNNQGRYVGANFSDKRVSTSDYLFEDDDGHGTHCAGIVCDMTLPNVKILPIKFMYYDTKIQKPIGTMSQAIDAVEYVIQQKRYYNIVAINMSFGSEIKSDGSTTYDENALKNVINRAYNYNVFSVVSAGNNSEDASQYMPANASQAITVSALKKSGSQIEFDTSYSNYGEVVDVCAPGSVIYSANAQYEEEVGHNLIIGMSGTSMAAPHVAGYIALLSSDSYVNYSKTQINQILNGTYSRYLLDLGVDGKDIYYGNGMPVLSNAIPDYVTLDVTCNELGTVDPVGYSLHIRGSSVVLTFAPDENSYVAAVYIDRHLVPNSESMNSYTLQNLSASHTVEVVFKSNTYTVNYYFEALNPTSTHQYNLESERFTGDIGTLTNAVAKNFSGFTVSGTVQQKIIEANGKTTVDIYYTRNRYSININLPEDDQGIKKIIGAGEYLYGAQVALIASIYDDFYLTNWECNNAEFANQLDLSSATQTFTMPAADLVFTPHSEERLCQVTVKITGNGSATPENITVHYGDGMIFELKADVGYELQSVQRNGTKLEANQAPDGTYSVNLHNITTDVELSVVFDREKKQDNGFDNWVFNGGGALLSAGIFGGLFIFLLVLFRIKKK